MFERLLTYIVSLIPSKMFERLLYVAEDLMIANKMTG